MKRLLILTAVTAVAISAQAQNTTYGGGNAPYMVNGGYVSDHSPGGTIVLADGSVTLSNNATYEHGNDLLQNNGSWTATSGSLDLFLNTGNNTISGSVAPSFYNVNFNNGAGNVMAITNTQGIQVTNQVQFNNGITTTVRNNTSTGALHFAAGATYTGVNSDARHVNGYVSKEGTTAFTFPVGSGTDLRTLSISAPAATAELSAAWFAGNPGTTIDPSDGSTHSITSVAAPLQSISQAGFWDWIPVSGSDDGLTITVSIPNVGSFGNTTDLRLAGWNGAQWIDLSGSATANGNTEGSPLSGTIPAGINITAIGVGSTGTPLPVTFSTFEVQTAGCRVNINWSTAQEVNNDHFQVERSTDGRSFNVIGKVQSAGSSTEQKDYSCIDAHPLSGINYYRVAQIDADGGRSTTAIKALRVDCGNDAIRVYPTVTEGTVYVAMPAGYEQAKIMVIDINGRQVRATIPKEGLVRIVQLSSLAAGTYLLKIEHDNRLETFKILYQP